MARMHSLKTPSRSTMRSCPFQSIEMHIPVHPVGRANGRFRWILRTLSNLALVLFGHQSRRDQGIDFLIDKSASTAELRREPFAHFLAHEHGVGADVNDTSLLEHACHERLNL